MRKNIFSCTVLALADYLKKRQRAPSIALAASAEPFSVAAEISTSSKQLKRCCDDVDRYLKYLEEDGAISGKNFVMGRGCICFQCGHVGVPQNNIDIGHNAIRGGDFGQPGGEMALPKCGICGCQSQTNLVTLRTADSEIKVWTEVDGIRRG